jgi:hypothetical protein
MERRSESTRAQVGADRRGPPVKAGEGMHAGGLARLDWAENNFFHFLLDF